MIRFFFRIFFFFIIFAFLVFYYRKPIVNWWLKNHVEEKISTYKGQAKDMKIFMKDLPERFKKILNDPNRQKDPRYEKLYLMLQQLSKKQSVKNDATQAVNETSSE